MKHVGVEEEYRVLGGNEGKATPGRVKNG